MRNDEARKLLKYALNNQDSIRTGKLGRILQAMNVSIKKDNEVKEIKYLRDEIRRISRMKGSE